MLLHLHWMTEPPASTLPSHGMQKPSMCSPMAGRAAGTVDLRQAHAQGSMYSGLLSHAGTQKQPVQDRKFYAPCS